MKKRQVVFVVFSICFVLAFLLFLFFQKGIGAGMVFQFVFSPLQKITIQSTQVFYEPSTIDQLREENTKLKTQLAKQQLVMQDNKALHDQFEINNPSPKSLLPAHIISMPSFFPGVSAPESLIIDKGKKNGVEEEMVVIIKDNLIGKVTKNNNYFSLVTLIGNKQTSFTAHTTQTNALGVIKGAGNGQLVFDNVVLSDTVKAGDMVASKGDTSLDGKGYPPGLIVGKITSVEKNPSALFQKANVQSMVDVTKTSIVFVMMGNK